MIPVTAMITFLPTVEPRIPAAAAALGGSTVVTLLTDEESS
jgi:hypothetical protein